MLWFSGVALGIYYTAEQAYQESASVVGAQPEWVGPVQQIAMLAIVGMALGTVGFAYELYREAET